MTFVGAKGALLVGGRMLVLLRDDLPWIDWPNHWDLPGGGREGAESPRHCWARETPEELGLDLAGADWLWQRQSPSLRHPDRRAWFFVARLPETALHDVRLGDEGQGWALLPPRLYLALPRLVPHLAADVRLWMASPEAAALGG